MARRGMVDENDLRAYRVLVEKLDAELDKSERRYVKRFDEVIELLNQIDQQCGSAVLKSIAQSVDAACQSELVRYLSENGRL